MDLSSFSLSSFRTWTYHVFPSFDGADTRRKFLSHLFTQCHENGITMFDDQEIQRGQTISPELTRGIRESKISLVILSRGYASSSWNLDQLLEILKCKEDMGQIVMTVFYGVDPSDVRKQTGDFGNIFNETCIRKTEEEKQRWIQALNDVAHIPGYNSQNWDNESKMIKMIARDISDKLDNKISHWSSTCMAFLVVINLLLEIASAVSEQLSSIRKPNFATISLVMSILSVVLSILDLTYKIRAHKARFRCKWPIPWFYYPARSYRRIFGSFTDTVLLFCVVGGLIVSTVNWSYIDKRREGPIKVSIWPLFFAIGMVGSKFMEKPAISKDYSLDQIRID